MALTLTERMERIHRDIDDEEAGLMAAELADNRRVANTIRRELQILYDQKDRLARTYHRRVLSPF